MLLTEIITTITTAITSFGGTAVQAIVDNFNTLVHAGEYVDGAWVVGTGLSDVAVWGLCFMGVSLVIGLGRLVTNMVRTKG